MPRSTRASWALMSASSLLAGALPAQESPRSATSVLHAHAEARAQLDANEPARAAPLLETIVQRNADDPHAWAELGHACLYSGRLERAIEAYRKARDLGALPQGDAALSIAQAHAALGRKDDALQWLERCLADGFEDRSYFATDSHFERLRDDERFRALAGELPRRQMSREGGWRYDLDFLLTEIRRLHYVYRERPLPDDLLAAAQSLRERISSLRDDQLWLELHRLTQWLGDGHSYVMPTGSLLAPPLRTPLHFYHFPDGLFVIGAADEYRSLVGERVTAIGGRDWAQVLSALEGVAPHDNSMSALAFAPYLLTLPVFLRALDVVPDARSVSFTVEARDGSCRNMEVASRPVGPEGLPQTDKKLVAPPGMPPPRYLARVADNFWLEHLSERKALYVQLNQLLDGPSESLGGFAARLQRTLAEFHPRHLIVDVRHNNGGDASLMRPLLRSIVYYDVERGGQAIYVLISRTTYSATQSFVNELDRWTDAVFVGEPTGSKPNFVGEDTRVILPYSGLQASLSSRYHQSDSRDQRVWIAPDVPAPLSSADYFAGRDPGLDAVFELIDAAGKRR